jgi:hypothetical protein
VATGGEQGACSTIGREQRGCSTTTIGGEQRGYRGRGEHRSKTHRQTHNVKINSKKNCKSKSKSKSRSKSKNISKSKIMVVVPSPYNRVVTVSPPV